MEKNMAMCQISKLQMDEIILILIIIWMLVSIQVISWKMDASMTVIAALVQQENE